MADAFFFAVNAIFVDSERVIEGLRNPKGYYEIPKSMFV